MTETDADTNAERFVVRTWRAARGRGAISTTRDFDTLAEAAAAYRKHTAGVLAVGLERWTFNPKRRVHLEFRGHKIYAPQAVGQRVL